MKQLIACCGLDCENCDARIDTVRDDNEAMHKASAWVLPSAVWYLNTEDEKNPYAIPEFNIYLEEKQSG